MAAIRSERRQVVRCWHPTSVSGPLFALPNGVNVECNTGPAAYQVSDGSKIEF